VPAGARGCGEQGRRINNNTNDLEGFYPRNVSKVSACLVNIEVTEMHGRGGVGREEEGESADSTKPNKTFANDKL
jgi:hypothetical protein